jgi:hypothetical protein
MSQLDPGLKAAECERAIAIVADPERRDILRNLRSVWIALSNQQSFLAASKKAGQLSAIARIHTELMSVYKNAMH